MLKNIQMETLDVKTIMPEVKNTLNEIKPESVLQKISKLEVKAMSSICY